MRLTPPVLGLVLSLTPVLTSCSTSSAGAVPDPSPSMSSSAPSPGLDTSRQDASLTVQIDRAIDGSELAFARWGVCVITLDDNRVLYARNADKLFTPASNMKVYTTAVALDQLGPDYRWQTSVYADASPTADGSINGNLTLYGRGAPDLSSRQHGELPASLPALAEQLYSRGVRHVRGAVVGDESYFRAEPLGDGWQWNDVQWYFGAEPSALTIDDNAVEVSIEPPQKGSDAPLVSLNIGQDYLHVSSAIASVKRGEQMRIGIHRGLSDNEITVWGEFPEGSRGFGARLSVHKPALWAARLFIAALKTKGIAVDGDAMSRDYRAPESDRFHPDKAVELASITSRSLGEVVKATNKASINLNAELILRTLGRVRGDTAPDPDPHRNYERGDDQAGVAVIQSWLNRAGVATDAIAFHDGSGLSRIDLVRPQTTTGLLAAVARRPVGVVFRDSLPIAGVDGTLGGRLRQFQGKVFAKTGSLAYDNSLSGYVLTPDGRTIAFSIMCNDQTEHANSTAVIDRIVGLLASYQPNSR